MPLTKFMSSFTWPCTRIPSMIFMNNISLCSSVFSLTFSATPLVIFFMFSPESSAIARAIGHNFSAALRGAIIPRPGRGRSVQSFQVASFIAPRLGAACDGHLPTNQSSFLCVASSFLRVLVVCAASRARAAPNCNGFPRLSSRLSSRPRGPPRRHRSAETHDLREETRRGVREIRGPSGWLGNLICVISSSQRGDHFRQRIASHRSPFAQYFFNLRGNGLDCVFIQSFRNFIGLRPNRQPKLSPVRQHVALQKILHCILDLGREPSVVNHEGSRNFICVRQTLTFHLYSATGGFLLQMPEQPLHTRGLQAHPDSTEKPAAFRLAKQPPLPSAPFGRRYRQVPVAFHTNLLGNTLGYHPSDERRPQHSTILVDSTIQRILQISAILANSALQCILQILQS
jgi:hypothetical protein